MAVTLQGTFIHTPSRAQLEVLENALIEVGSDGVIQEIVTSTQPNFAAARDAAIANQQLHQIDPKCVVLPGMVDLHIHAPQWPQLGKALHLPLEEWLMEYTFPLEAKYKDVEFARSVYRSLVNTLIANGTTTAVYFSSIHREASQVLATECLRSGQRSFVGKVVMDEPSQCPDYYRDASASTALDDTRGFIADVQQLQGNTAGLVQPIVTPRFVPSCTDQALRGLGEIAKETRCRVQTHCSESDWQHNYVLERFGKTDTEVLASFDLLRPGSVLAHSNFVSSGDMQIIKDYDAGIAHCPLSNSYFANSVFPLREALNKGVKVGLGTDIAGGPSPSLFHNAACAITSSRMLEEGVDPSLPSQKRGRSHSRINFLEAFWLATAGGAEVLNIPVGNFKKGHHFDALLIDSCSEHSNIVPFDDTPDFGDLLQSIVYNVTRDNISAVWVDGNIISGSVCHTEQ